jgi:hypothetical protein
MTKTIKNQTRHISFLKCVMPKLLVWQAMTKTIKNQTRHISFLKCVMPKLLADVP